MKHKITIKVKHLPETSPFKEETFVCDSFLYSEDKIVFVENDDLTFVKFKDIEWIHISPIFNS